jgi:Na+-driven multidrug efflux pump
MSPKVLRDCDLACDFGSLGMQDSWGPLKSLAIASGVNLTGDILLCTVMGYGIAGAAWATMASQVCCDAAAALVAILEKPLEIFPKSFF